MVRKICVRCMKFGDIKEVLSLEGKCWQPHLRPNIQKISKYLQISKEQFVVEMDRTIIGVLFTQRIRSEDVLREGKFENQVNLHDNNGTILQLCAIAVDGDISGGNIGAELRNFALKYARSCGTLTSVVAVTRCSNFSVTSISSDLAIKEKNSLYEEYVYNGRDPTIFFHISGGAKILGIVQDYRSEDYQNLGHGVLIAYDLHQVCNMVNNFKISI